MTIQHGNAVLLMYGPADDPVLVTSDAPLPTTGGGGGGGGGAVTVADAADVTQGAKANAAATDSTSAWSVISLLKGLYAKLAGTLSVAVGADVVAVGAYGGKAVGTSAVQLIAASNPAVKGVLVKTDDSNTGSVYVGLSNAVTADAGGANSGIRLPAGSSLTVPVSDANKVYLIGSAASQNVAWMAC